MVNVMEVFSSNKFFVHENVVHTPSVNGSYTGVKICHVMQYF